MDNNLLLLLLISVLTAAEWGAYIVSGSLLTLALAGFVTGMLFSALLSQLPD